MTANSVLNRMQLWSIKNGFTMNANKTKAIIFRAKGRYVDAHFDLQINLSQIEMVASVNSLGVYFHQAISWNTHIDPLTSKQVSVLKLSQVAGQVYLLRHLPRQLKLLI